MLREYPPGEAAPCGETGLLTLRQNRFFPFKRDYHDDLSDCLVTRPKPWRLVIWEPLLTDAPGPPKAEPHCCYIQTVIFYHSPLHSSTGGECDKFDQIETRLGWDDVVRFEGDDFAIGGGQVKWAHGRWWMLRWARRVEERNLLKAAAQTEDAR